jgi:sugar lactone lactonase YvrE
MRRTLEMASRFSRTLVPVLFVTIAAMPSCAVAQIPAVVFSAANGYTQVPDISGNQYSGTAGKIAANARGDIFADISSNGNNGCASTYLLEVPANGGPLNNLITGMGCPYGGDSVYADAAGNVYVADTADAKILYVPFVHGGYPAAASASALPNCSAFPVPATQTATCVVPLSYPGNLGYYVQVGDLGFDAAGNLYLLDKFTGGGFYGGVDLLLEVSATDGSFTILNSTLGNDAFAEIAVDKVGDVLLKDNGSGTFYTAGNYTNGQGIFYLNNPQGVSIDAGGNFYINDEGNSRIVEIPSASVPANVNTNFVVSNQLGTYFGSGAPSNGVGIDGFGTLYFGGNYPNSISYLKTGQLVFGSTAVGTTSGSQGLNLVFNSAVTFGSISATGLDNAFTVASTTCTSGAAYAVAANCAVNVTYSASAPGRQTGQLQAFDSSGNLLGTATLAGTGQGSQLNFDPGLVSAAGSLFTSPTAVATDGAGDFYVADSSTGSVYKTTFATPPATPVTVATGFSSPSAVVVDGAGNVYVGDAGNGQVVEVPYNSTAGTYGANVVLATGLKGASGLALDGLGDLYVADSGNARVLRLGRAGDGQLGSLPVAIGSGFTTPVAVAVDSTNQNVYISDSGSGTVVQLGIFTGTQSAVSTGLTTPAGLAVDASGSLFIVDSGKATITRVPYVNGALNKNLATTLGGSIAQPAAIALDASGNLFVADTADATVTLLQRQQGALNFGNVNVSSTSSTVAAQVSESGTASVTLATPPYAQSGATMDFTIDGSSTCVGGATLNTGQSCTVASSFSPLTKGVETDTLTFTDNNGNAAGTLALSGTGTQLATSTLTLAVTLPTTPPSFGQAVVVQATLAPVAGAVGTPTGTVTFYVDAVPQPAATLTADAARITLTGLNGGTHSITASYSGDDNFAGSASSALTVSVATSTTVTTLAIAAPFTNPTSANPAGASYAGASSAVTLTATVTPALPGAPTGSVTFFNGTTSLGTAIVLAGKTAGTATLSFASGHPSGTYSITAVYPGDANYAASTSAAPASLLITDPTIAMTTTATTILGGGAPVTLTVASVAGFNNAADLACSGLPAYSACSFSPAYAFAAPGTPATVTLSVVVNQPPLIAPTNAGISFSGQGRLGIATVALLLLPLLLLGRRRGIRLRPGLFALLLSFGCIAGLVGCGSGSSANFRTPTGTTTLTVTSTITTGAISPPPAQTLMLQLKVN